MTRSPLAAFLGGSGPARFCAGLNGQVARLRRTEIAGWSIAATGTALPPALLGGDLISLLSQPLQAALRADGPAADASAPLVEGGAAMPSPPSAASGAGVGRGSHDIVPAAVRSRPGPAWPPTAPPTPAADRFTPTLGTDFDPRPSWSPISANDHRQHAWTTPTHPALAVRTDQRPDRGLEAGVLRARVAEYWALDARLAQRRSLTAASNGVAPPGPGAPAPSPAPDGAPPWLWPDRGAARARQPVVHADLARGMAEQPPSSPEVAPSRPDERADGFVLALPTAVDTADDLAERIAAILAEQALEHGIDVS